MTSSPNQHVTFSSNTSLTHEEAFRLLVTRLNTLRAKWLDQVGEMQQPGAMGVGAGLAHASHDLWLALTTPLKEDVT